MGAFVCTCRAVTGKEADPTGCVVHDRSCRLQFERDEALEDKERHKRHAADLADTLNLIAVLVEHRGAQAGDDLVKTVRRVVEDRDWKHKQWARLTGTGDGTRVMKRCSECDDRVSICTHAQKAQDDARIASIGLQEKLRAKQLEIDKLEREVAAPSQERQLLLYLEKCVRELYSDPNANPWPAISVTLADLENGRKR